MATVFISYSARDSELASSLTSFLRSRGIESIFLDRDERDGILPGAAWKRELFREVRACEIMVVLWSRSSADSRWCFFERTLAATWGKRFLPVHLDDTPLDSDLSTVQGISYATGDAWERLVESLRRLAIGSRVAFRWEKSRPPYPGLLSFDLADARVFFGREREVQAGLDSISQISRHQQGGWIVLVGPSGCGKSSILRAGILARLHLDEESWVVAAPMRAGELTTPKLDRLAPPAAGDDRTLVVGLDQLEELFDEENTSNDATARLIRLNRWARAERVICVCTLRADFHGHFQKLAGKLDIRFRTQPVESFPLDSLERVIVGPAEVAGLDVDAALTAKLLTDAAGDSLPLLAFTLREIYERGDKLSLSRRVYDELGGIEGAAAGVADRVLASHGLDAARHAQFLETLVRLVRVNEKDEPIRRPLPKSEIASELDPLFQDLIENRLLVASGDSDPVVELSHEALIRVWKPLRDIVQSERDFFTWHRRLQIFMSSGSPQHVSQDLLHDQALIEAQRWLQRYPQRLNRAEQELIRRSREADEAELEQKLRIAEELAKTKSVSARRALIGLAVAIGLGVVAIVLMVVANQRRADADAERKSAQDKATRLLAYSLVQASDDVLPADRELALLLALEAYGREKGVAIRRRIYAASQPGVRVGGHSDAVVAADWSPAENVVATGSKDGTIRFWTHDGSLTRILTANGRIPRIIDFSHSGRYLASLSTDGTVDIWSKDGDKPVRLAVGHDADYFQWSPTSDTILVASPEGLAVYDATGRVVAPWTQLLIEPRLFEMPGPFFGPDGNHVAAATRNGVHVLSLSPQIRATTLPVPGKSLSLRWQSAETLLVSGSKTSVILRTDGRVVWQGASGADEANFFVAGLGTEFVSRDDDSKMLVVRDAAGGKLRELAAGSEFDQCLVLGGTLYCRHENKLQAEATPVDFGYTVSSISQEGGRMVLAGVSKTGDFCEPRGADCRPFARIPDKFREFSNNRDRPFALGKSDILLGKEGSCTAVILGKGGSADELEHRGTLWWTADGCFLVNRNDRVTQYSPTGSRRARDDCQKVSLSPASGLSACVSNANRTITIRNLDGTVRRSMGAPEGEVSTLDWGPNGRRLSYGSTEANFVADAFSQEKPTQLPPGTLRWSPQDEKFAVVPSDFSPRARRGTVMLHAPGAEAVALLKATAFDTGECDECLDIRGWSPGGRYFVVCYEAQGLAADIRRPGTVVKVPCAMDWSADDAWYVARNGHDLGDSIYSMADGKAVLDLPERSDTTWSPRGALLAVQEGSALSYWSPQDNLKRIATLPDPEGHLKFAPTGEQMMWFSGTQGLMIDRDRRVKEVYFPDSVEKISWSHEGMLVAAVRKGADEAGENLTPVGVSTTYVLNRAGELVAQLAGSDASWSNTGQRLALALGDEHRIWDLREEVASAEALRFVSRSLTSDEQRRYGLAPSPGGP